MTMAAAETFLRLGITSVMTSQTNPRKHYDEAALHELSLSIEAHGILEPILVRDLGEQKKGTRYEIVAGERRYRAAMMMLDRTTEPGLPRKVAYQEYTLPALVREYSDEEALEIQVLENIHRQDFAPLEEAAGFRALIDKNPDKHSAESIATKIGRSPDYVWDLLSLLKLVLEAKRLLERGLIGKAHAVRIAREKPEDQKRIIAPPERDSFRPDSGLWAVDSYLPSDAEEKAGEKDPYFQLKPKSLRELDAWINDHVRFDLEHAAKAQPFSELVVETVEEAKTIEAEAGKKIWITHDYRVQDDAKDPEARTYGPQSWRRADGQEKSKTCDHSVLGVVAAGGGRGSSFAVCIARDRCKVHFGKEIKAKEQNERDRASGKTKRADNREARERARQEREEAKREAARVRWNKFLPALKKATLEAAAKRSAVNGPLYLLVLSELGLPSMTKPSELLRALMQRQVRGAFQYAWERDEPKLMKWAKALGVDVKACEPPAEKKAEAKS